MPGKPIPSFSPEAKAARATARTSMELKTQARTLELDADWQRERAHLLDDQARELLRKALVGPGGKDAFLEDRARQLRAEATMRRELAHARDDEARALLRRL